jgi:hypothetical protein
MIRCACLDGGKPSLRLIEKQARKSKFHTRFTLAGARTVVYPPNAKIWQNIFLNDSPLVGCEDFKTDHIMRTAGTSSCTLTIQE